MSSFPQNHSKIVYLRPQRDNQVRSGFSIALKIRAMGFPRLFDELVDSLFLFFCRDLRSKKIAESLGVDVNLILDFRSIQTSVRPELQLQDFPSYSPRLQHIQRKMNDWRPQTFRQLSERPYKDPITYYAFWAALALGIVTVMRKFDR